MLRIRALSQSKALLIALVALAFGPALAEAQLKLLINKDDNVGRFVINGDVAYNTATGVVAMDVFLGKDAAGDDNPLFCFDFSSEPQTVTLDIDGDARVLAKGLKLTSALQYQLSAQTIAITPSNDVACFFRAYDEGNDQLGVDFGLYGQIASASGNSSGVIFADDFSVNPQLKLTFSDFQAGEYVITVTNDSPFELTSLAFQQSLPEALGVTQAGVECRVNGEINEAVCTDARKDVLRYEGFTLAAGEKLELTVTVTGTTAMDIYGAVAAPTVDGVAFDVGALSINP